MAIYPDNHEPDAGQEDEELRCPECGAVMDADDEVCPQCGAEFAFYCPQCGEEIPADATVCPHCGSELDEGVEDESEPIDEGKVDAQAAQRVGSVPRAEFCSNCGGPIAPDDEECPACGADLCPDCGTALGSDDAVCPNCGAEFVFSCPNCGEDVPVSAEVCPYCKFEFEEIELEEEDVDE